MEEGTAIRHTVSEQQRILASEDRAQLRPSKRQQSTNLEG